MHLEPIQKVVFFGTLRMDGGSQQQRYRCAGERGREETEGK